MLVMFVCLVGYGGAHVAILKSLGWKTWVYESEVKGWD
jgi:hypothetical protein